MLYVGDFLFNAEAGHRTGVKRVVSDKRESGSDFQN